MRTSTVKRQLYLCFCIFLVYLIDWILLYNRGTQKKGSILDISYCIVVCSPLCSDLKLISLVVGMEEAYEFKIVSN
jgi:hypothetical protein